MKTYTFYLVLSTPEVTDADCDRLFDAGCDDATVVTRDRRTLLAFDREASSLEHAIRTAADDVRAAGFAVSGVEMDAPSPLSQAG